MADRSSTRLPRHRLRPVGAPGPDAAVWATRAGAAVLVIALGACIYALCAPQGATGAGVAPEIPVLSAWQPPAEPEAAARGELLARMRDAHVFSPRRDGWLGPAPEVPIITADEAQAPTPLTAQAPQVDSSGEQVVVMNVSRPDDVDKAVRTSFETIRLRGIRTTSAGQPAAIFAFAHSRQPDAGVSVTEGQSFKVPRAKEGDDTWILERVDLTRNRAYMRLESSTLGLALFPDDAIEAGRVTFHAPPASVAGTVVESAAPETTAAPAPIKLPDGTALPTVKRMDRDDAMEEIRRRAAELEGKENISLDDLAELMMLTEQLDKANKEKAPPRRHKKSKDAPPAESGSEAPTPSPTPS